MSDPQPPPEPDSPPDLTAVPEPGLDQGAMTAARAWPFIPKRIA